MRFADNELLKTMLGVEQGHLSLFAKMNDPENKVQVIIDKRLLDAPTVSLHPLINTSSTIISHEDFLLFANKYAPGYRVMEFSFVSFNNHSIHFHSQFLSYINTQKQGKHLEVSKTVSYVQNE